MKTISVIFSSIVARLNPQTGKNTFPAIEGISFDDGVKLLREGKVHDINAYRPSDWTDAEWKAGVQALQSVLQVSNAVYQMKTRKGTVRVDSIDGSDRVWFPVKTAFTSFVVPKA